MKVLHIINNLGSGGAEKLIEEILPLMNSYKNIDADVLLLTDKKNVFTKKLKDSGVNLDVISLKKTHNPLNIFYIRRHITKNQYDIVHAHLFPTNYWVSIASKLIFKNKPKFFITEHNTHNRRRERAYFKYIDRYIYSNYDRIISISEKTQENLMDWLEETQKNINKFNIIENGIDVDSFIRAQPYIKSEIHSSFTKDSKLICMVGSFTKQKDQSTLIKAIAKLPKDVSLLLIGEGPLKEESQNLTRKNKLQDRVHFLGFRSDVNRIFKTSDIIVLSSHWEGFGLVAAEGMATGTPVIASNVEGLKNVVKGGGITFELGNSEDLADKIMKLLKDKRQYNVVSQLCVSKSKEYDIRKMTNKYLELYEVSLLKDS